MAYEMRISDWSSDVCSSDLLGDGVVRCIALGSTDGLKRNLVAVNTGKGIAVPVGKGTLGRIMDVLGRPIDEAGPIDASEDWEIHRAAPSYEEQAGGNELLETGIKVRSEEHTSELQSLMRTSHAVFCLKKKKHQN